MKYDLNCNAACESSPKTGPIALPMRRQSSTSGLAGIAVLVALGVFGVVRAAHAADAQDRQAIRQACAADRQSLCSGVQPGGGRIIACFQQNAAKISAPCRQALAGLKKEQ
jgi:hypothetical protein